MSIPQIEFVNPRGHALYDLDHTSLHEQRDVGRTEVAGKDNRAAYLGGLGRIHMALADAAEREGFKIAEGKADFLVQEMSRTVEHNRAIREALATPGSAADAALQNASALADAYGRIYRNAQREVIRPFAREMASRMRDQFGARAVADAVSGWCANATDRKGRRKPITVDATALADADLNLAGGLVENLTQYLYMAFREPQAPLHYRDMFRVQGGINIGLMYLQVLFYTIRGEASVWDGTAGDYGNSGPGVSQLKLPVVHFRSSDNLDIITAARETLVFGGQNLRTEQLRRAHELMVNRASFGIQNGSPEQLPTLNLRNWPGVTVKTAATPLDEMTPYELFEEMQAAIQEPLDISNQAFDPDTLAITVAINTQAQKPMVIGGTPVGISTMGYFKQQFPRVDVRVMWELKDLYASGTDSMVAYPKGSDAAPVALWNEPVMLPQFTYGFGVRSDMYSTFAGIVWPAPVGAEVRNINRS